MDCERLQNLIKSWYAQVQDEALAPARMVAFMQKHIAECSICLLDPVVKQEVEKISAFVLPPSKIPKALKEAGEEETEEEEEAETEEVEDETDEDEEVEDEDEDSDDEDEDSLEDDDFDDMDDDDI